MAELIILPLLKALPVGGMLQTAPISPEDAVVWADKYPADKVYFWPRTKSAFIAIVNIPNPFYGPAQGAYYYGTGLYWCNYRSACIHEIGHKLDDQGGMISQSEDFIQAVQDYAVQDEWGDYIQSFPADVAFPVYGNRNMELYASLYARANGSPVGFPLSLMKFYDWNSGLQEINSLTIKD